MHSCPDCGFGHDEPVVVEEVPEAAVEKTVEADVEIARIEGDTAVKIAKIEAGVAEDMMETRLSELEGHVRGMREVLDRLAPPEPEPVAEAAPIVVTDVQAEPEPEMPPREEQHQPKAPSRPKGFFG